MGHEKTSTELGWYVGYVEADIDLIVGACNLILLADKDLSCFSYVLNLQRGTPKEPLLVSILELLKLCKEHNIKVGLK